MESMPKTGFVGRKEVPIVGNDAVMIFNDGLKAILKVMEK